MTFLSDLPLTISLTLFLQYLSDFEIFQCNIRDVILLKVMEEKDEDAIYKYLHKDVKYFLNLFDW